MGCSKWRSCGRRHRKLSINLRNRKRIWLLCRSMQQVLSLRFPREPGAYDMTSRAGRTVTWLEDESVKEKLESINWDLQLQAEMLWKPHFCFHSLYVYVPDPIASLSFSFATLGNRRYLAGLTIYTATTGQSSGLGYEGPSFRIRKHWRCAADEHPRHKSRLETGLAV